MEDKLVPLEQAVRGIRYVKSRERCWLGGIMLILSGINFISDYNAENETIPLLSFLLFLAGLICFMNVTFDIRGWNYIGLKNLQSAYSMIGLGVFDVFGLTILVFRYATPGMVMGVIAIIMGLKLFVLLVSMKLYRNKLFVEPEENNSNSGIDYR